MKCVYLCAVVLFFAVLAGPALAHVPYLEREDYSDEAPFQVKNSVEQSIAVYAWLGPDGNDRDVYEFVLEQPALVYVETLVPVCDVYRDVYPSFAIVGPGFPPDSGSGDLPFNVPDGLGVTVVNQDMTVDPRPEFYEPFGGKSYYQGPTFEQAVDTPGTYRIHVWDPLSLGGDYVAVIGNEEIWRASDITHGLILTPVIRRDREIHSDECAPQGKSE